MSERRLESVEKKNGLAISSQLFFASVFVRNKLPGLKCCSFALCVIFMILVSLENIKKNCVLGGCNDYLKD